MYLSLYRPAPRAVSRRSFDGLFDSVFSDFFTSGGASAEGGAKHARLDLVEKGDHYEASLEVPGVEKEGIDVKIEGNRVSVTAQAKGENVLKDGERILYTERHSSSFVRVFELPVEVAEDRAEASYQNGVLKLVLPKKETVQAKRLQVN